jgi:hypothetical protein
MAMAVCHAHGQKISIPNLIIKHKTQKKICSVAKLCIFFSFYHL